MSAEGKEASPGSIDDTGLCLLSLDGGGVRGLSTLYILKSLMDQLNHNRKPLPAIKPCEVFDLIGGTSTGGMALPACWFQIDNNQTSGWLLDKLESITMTQNSADRVRLIAIMLGRLEMDIDECISAYTELTKKIFEKKSRMLPLGRTGKVKPRFNSKTLEDAINDVILRRGGTAADLFNDGSQRHCRTFVCTAAQENTSIVRLRSYSMSGAPNLAATVTQAALATSAATTFFDPVSIGDRSFADGALGANNPVNEVEGEASSIWCSNHEELKPLVKCFISIGTGHPGTIAIEDSIFKLLGQTMVKMATESWKTEESFMARWTHQFETKRYFRFNVDQGLQNIGLHEHEKKGIIEAATEKYLIHPTQKLRLRDCVENLKLKRHKTDLSFASSLEMGPKSTLDEQVPPCHDSSKPMEANLDLRTAMSAPWLVPFERNRCFTGRDSLLAELEASLFAEDQTTKIAITGLGGVGKTQLALELTYRVKAKRKQCAILWIPATSMDSLEQAYAEAARQLGIPGWDKKNTDVKKLVQNRLSQDTSGQWLLLFDNADDINMWISSSTSTSRSSRLIDCLPRSKQGCIVFTTRDKKTAVKLAHQNVVEVPDIGQDVATELFDNYLLNKSLQDQENASILIQRLVRLPLAIVQAATYINENSITIKDYISLLEEQEEDVIELLSEEFEDDGRYQDIKNPVATTWLISFDRIKQRDPLAAELLSFMACIDPKEIPISLLPSGPSRKKQTDAIGTLVAYSFVTRRSADSTLNIHRLVHLAIRNWLRNEDRFTHQTNEAIFRLLEVFLTGQHLDARVCRSYLPHITFLGESKCISQAHKLKFFTMYSELLKRDNFSRSYNIDGLYNVVFTIGVGEGSSELSSGRMSSGAISACHEE